ncbi:TPA: hypothetical protein ACH3X3_008561 [Trebouxia sp. C0006]
MFAQALVTNHCCADCFYLDTDLLAPNFKPGNDRRDRIRDRLQHGLEPVRLLCVKTQHNNVVEIDFAAVSGLISSECIAHEHQQTTSAGVQAPSASYLQQIALSAAVKHDNNADTDDNTPMDHLHELYEWIGGVSCGLQGHDWHSLDEQHMQEVALHKNTWTGLVAPCQVQKAVKLGQQLVHEGKCPWAIVSAWGFKGQPISWIGAPPNSASSVDGENDYSIVILPDGQYMLLVASGSGDSFQTV